MNERINQFIEKYPWIYLVASAWLGIEALSCLRQYRALKIVQTATEIAKDAADA